MTAHAAATLPHTTQTENEPRAAQTRLSSHSRTPSATGSTVSGVRKPAPHAASSGTILMSPEALQNNERLFPMFQADLSEDRVDGNYASSAEKLAGWLSKDRAYYPAARPWIVTLIETAQQTIRRIAGNTLPQDRPFHVSLCPSVFMERWVNPYIKLLKVVRRFDHLFVEPDLRVRLEALLYTIDAPPTPTVHAPAPSVLRSRAASAASRTSSAASPAPYSVPAPMPAASALIRYAPPNSASPVGYYIPSHHMSPTPIAAPALNVTIPPATPPYYPHAASPAQMSPFAAPGPFSMGQPAPLSRPVSRPGSSSSASTMPARPSSVSSHTGPRIVSAPVPPGATSPATSVPTTPDLSVSATVKRKSKTKRILANDFMTDDVEWFRQQQEKEKQAQLETKQAVEQPVSAIAPRSPEPEQDKETPTDVMKIEEPSKDVPAVLGPGPTDQPADSRSADTEQDIQMVDATAAAADAPLQADAMAVDAVKEPSNEIPMQVDPKDIPPQRSAPISGATERAKENEAAAASADNDAGSVAAVELLSSTFAATVAPISPTRILDLSKLSSQTAPKAKKLPPPDLLYSKVAQPPKSVRDKPDSSTSSATAVEPRSDRSSDEPPPPAATTEDAVTQSSMGERLSHIVKSPKSKKGPPGIKASELTARIQASLPSTTPPDVDLSRVGITLHSKTGSGLKLKLLPPKPPSPPSAQTPSRSSTPTKSTARAIEGSSTPRRKVSSSSQHTVGPGADASPTAMVGPHASGTMKPSSSSDSEDDEPLAARQRRVGSQRNSPSSKRTRTRSRSPNTPPAQRRKSAQGTSVATPTPSRRSSLVVRTQPREYTIDAFASGNFVYSPIQTEAPNTISQTDMDVDERDGSPVMLPASLTRAPPSGKPGKPSKRTRTVEDMGLRAEPFTDKELRKMSIFRDGSKILAFERGKPFGDPTPITLSFKLEQEEYDACLLWSKQKDHKHLTKDPAPLRCFSLSCYSFTEIDRKRQGLNNPSIEEVFAGKPTDFPWHQRVRLRIENRDPPAFEVTWADLHLSRSPPDQLLDLSKTVRPGVNKIELCAGKLDIDHSYYVFVLRLHPLTPRQAKWWWDRKRNQVKWEQTLRRASRIDVPPINLDKYAKRIEAVQA